MLKSMATSIRKFSEQLDIDEDLEKTIKRIPQLPQRQYDIMKYLRKAAVRLGLYDADDFLEKYTARKSSKQLEAFLPPHGYETLLKIRRPELKKQDPKQERSNKIEPLKPGEMIDVYENGKWLKIKWPGSKD